MEGLQRNLDTRQSFLDICHHMVATFAEEGFGHALASSESA
jgi:hypothetical protein